MSLSERRQQFETASKADPLFTPQTTKFHRLFGVSNSAKIIARGLQLGVVNLDNLASMFEGFAFACTMFSPPADEVYFTAYVCSGAPSIITRLAEMKQLGAGQATVAPPAIGESAEEPSGQIGYGARNNNV